ncbi:MAG: threonine--tRNA ligase [Candidatus Nanohaloarchaea archaeon]|nr:threonine--tRNA ligase [Candidatus Nanohaloarchaea archaeon]
MGEIRVRLPDGSEIEVEEGATVEDVAYEIGEGLGDDCAAGKIDGELVAKEERVEDGAEIEIVTPGSDEYINVLRHSAAHVLAQAVKRIYPDVNIGMGPWTDEGFYYDFDNLDISEEDFERIEAEMQKIIDQDLEIERKEPDSEEEAEEILEGEPYKQELLEDFRKEGKNISFYRQGEFIDLCKGPHLDSTGEIDAFKLMSVAAAYWKGEEENKMLTRVYATAFPKESQLEEFIERRKEAEKRDHRKIGKQMNLFSIQQSTGRGLPLYHPNGKIVLNELREFMQGLNRDRGCRPVETPHLFRTDLWKDSGHYDNYQDDMFLFEVGDDEYGLKPMNCPAHARIFKSQAWSYRDLPVRYTEQGKVYRKEQHGELSGLSRVWAFTIDDGHLFVRPDQIEEEVSEILDLVFEVLETFDLEYKIFLATRPDKSVGSDEIWEKAESQLKKVLESRDLDYELEDGDGAFYGPKIDFAFEDALGREWDGPTVQLDFNMPERFDLTYKGEDNNEHRPVMIHRALYGSYARFFMTLIEHFAGNFPLWLAPEQVRILPISGDQLGYAREIKEELSEFRVEVEDRSWTLGKKIQTAHDDRVPYMVIVGDKEKEEGSISVRDREEREEKGINLEEFKEHLERQVEQKTVEPDFLS